MIGTLLRIGWLHLLRDPPALALTFLLPPVLFTVFASVFGGMDDASARPVRTVLVVQQHDAFSASLEERLRADPLIDVVRTLESDGSDAQLRAAGDMVRAGTAAVAVAMPSGLGHDGVVRLDVIADRSNPVAVGQVSGALQKGAFALAAGGGLVPAVDLRVSDAHGRNGRRPSVAFFAAGLGVMFLLFSVSGRSAILIDERESGVLIRLRAAGVGVGRLIVARWMFLAGLGVAQVSAMFVWGELAFGLDLWEPRRLAGFALVTVATSAAAAAFGLALASVCRTRGQLHGLATVIVLIMSAVGGSMFPTFLLPDWLQTGRLLLFNAWALDAYHDVFWYDAVPSALLLPVAALIVSAGAFLVVAAQAARRREGRV